MPVGSRIAVEGTVTAVPGRVLRAGVTFLQDGTGGIAVALPDGIDASADQTRRHHPAVGHAGRPVRQPGAAGDPTPADLRDPGSWRSAEPRDPHLRPGWPRRAKGSLARVTGVIEGVETGSSGSLAITLRDNGGEARVFVFGARGRDPRPVHDRRPPRRDRHRRSARVDLRCRRRLSPVAPRDPATSSSPPRPRRTRPGGDSRRRDPTRDGSRPGRACDARRRRSASGPRTRARRVTIQGTITAPAGLLDGEGRRVTIQDGSGAILLRYPDGARPPGGRHPGPGDRRGRHLVRRTPARGRGRAHRCSVGRTASPVVLRRAPGAADEWRLVRVTVRITDVARSGETWRAEASLGAGGSLPIVGVAGSHIPSTALAEGRNATITGIVKRAYPTASDQRFALVPAECRGHPAGSRPGHARARDRRPTHRRPPRTQPDTGRGWRRPTAPRRAVVDTTLDGLTGLAGRHVRVSGALRRVDRSAADHR